VTYDQFARIVYGLHTSLLVGFASAVLSTVVGVLAGNAQGHLAARHFPEGPSVEARDEDVVLDPALTALEDSASMSS
jgi:hypothetical protein